MKMKNDVIRPLYLSYSPSVCTGSLVSEKDVKIIKATTLMDNKLIKDHFEWTGQQ